MILSHDWVPLRLKKQIPNSVSAIWRSSGKRLRRRAKSSGFKNALHLWSEEMKLTDEVWIGGPYDISPHEISTLVLMEIPILLFVPAFPNSANLERAAT